MKIELPIKPLDHIKEAWEGQFSVFSWLNPVVNLPSAIFVITTKKENGLPNAQLNAWGMLLGSGTEPKFVFSLMRTQDTYRLLKDGGECIINYPSRSIRDTVFRAMEHFEDGEDEIAACGLTAEEGKWVDVMWIAECHTHLECRVDQIVDLEQEDKVNAMVICSVIGGAIDEAVCDDKLIPSLDKKGLIMYINEHLNPKTGATQGLGANTVLDYNKVQINE